MYKMFMYVVNRQFSSHRRAVTSNKVVEKIKTHILCSIFFFFENRAVYMTMWKYKVEPNRPEMVIQYGACALHAA